MAPFIPRPDEVTVCHRTYRINWCEQEQWVAEKLDDDQRGYSNHVTGNIYIRLSYSAEDDNARATDDMMREVLTHELLHVCTSVSMVWNCWDALAEKHRSDWSDVEEILVGGLGPHVLTMLKDNPDVLAYLLDDREHE